MMVCKCVERRENGNGCQEFNRQQPSMMCARIVNGSRCKLYVVEGRVLYVVEDTVFVKETTVNVREYRERERKKEKCRSDRREIKKKKEKSNIDDVCSRVCWKSRCERVRKRKSEFEVGSRYQQRRGGIISSVC